MEYKILQIIPINNQLTAKYKQDDGVSDSPIVCLGLIEWKDGSRAVKPMDISKEGEISFVDEFSNFLEVGFE